MKGKYIDFHAHILPGTDHGCDCAETARRQLKSAEAAGVCLIVATPHFYPERHSTRSFFARRDEALALLEALGSGIKIVPGAEVRLCNGLNALPELKMLGIGESGSILIEMPQGPWTAELIDSLLRTKSEQGLNVILAHVERYPSEQIEELFRLGIKGQVNASAFASLTRRGRYYKWIDGGFVVALGSDVHGESRAYKDYSRAMLILRGRGERLQKSMCDLIFRTRVKDTEGSV